MQWLSDLNEFANPLSTRMYKVVLSLDALGPALDRYVARRSELLHTLAISSDEGTAHFNGIYLPRPADRLFALGYQRVEFRSDFTVSGTIRNLVRLHARRFRLYDPDATVDLMRIASKLIPGIQRRFVRALCTSTPHIFQTAEIADEVLLNIEYFLEKVPAFMNAFGEISLARVRVIENNRVAFYVQTNLFLVRMVDFFGPEYLSLEEIQDRDTMEMLWESPR